MLAPRARRSIPAHAPDEPSDRQRNGDRSIRTIFNGVAQRLFERRSVTLHGPGRFPCLAVEVLRRSSDLLHSAFNLALDVARRASNAILQLTAQIVRSAGHPVLVHRHIPVANRSVIKQPAVDFVQGRNWIWNREARSHVISEVVSIAPQGTSEAAGAPAVNLLGAPHESSFMVRLVSMPQVVQT